MEKRELIIYDYEDLETITDGLLDELGRMYFISEKEYNENNFMEDAPMVKYKITINVEEI